MKDHVERLARVRVQMLKERALVEARMQELLDAEADAEVPAPAPAPSRLSASEGVDLSLEVIDLLDQSVKRLKDLAGIVADLVIDVDAILHKDRPPIGTRLVDDEAGPSVVCPAGADCPDPIGGLRHFSEEAGA